MSDCQNMVMARDLCQVHYKRWQRHGDVLPTRAVDWGAREKHPLYSVWNYLMRVRRSETCERWSDLWNFVTDIGDSRPTMKHRLERIQDAEPLGPNNFFWATPRLSGKTEDEKVSRAAYMRTWNAANMDRVIEGGMRKKYGIGLKEYEEMLAAQNGVCAICLREETRIDHRTKKVSRLAIDHDHKTGIVRALLCQACNVSLGAFSDDPDRLSQAIAYLERHTPQRIN